jgi:hypothetical protein
MKSQVFCVLGALLLGGCVATGPKFETADATPQGRGILYIYRMPTILGSAAIAEFYIDDKHVISLSSDGYSYCYLTAGPHELTQYFNLQALDRGVGFPVAHTLLDFTMSDGGTQYIQFEINGGMVGGMAGKVWGMTKVDGSVPPFNIKDRHFEAPDNKLCG